MGMNVVDSQAITASTDSTSATSHLSSNAKNCQQKSARLLQAQYQDSLNNQNHPSQPILSPTSNQYSNPNDYIQYMRLQVAAGCPSNMMRANALSQFNYNYHRAQVRQVAEKLNYQVTRTISDIFFFFFQSIHYANNYEDFIKANAQTVDYQNKNFENNMTILSGCENNPSLAYSG
jgi:hypothetical protein